MIQARAVEYRKMTLQRQGLLHFCEECIGEEAAHVAPVTALEHSDWFQTDRRQFGTYIKRGRSLEDIFLFWLRGYEVWDQEFEADVGPLPHLRRMPHTVAIGTTIPQAVGMIWGQKYQGGMTTSA